LADVGVVVTAPGEAALEEIRVGRPGPGEVLVRIEATGVCHTDLTVLRDNWAHRPPILLGHEGAGVVEAAGDGVELAPGDRVVLGWRAPCGGCAWCLRGTPRLCRGTRPARAVTRADGKRLQQALTLGTFATRTVVPAGAAVRITAELPWEEASLIGCCVATGVMSVLETAKVWEGARVAVIGCGAVGLSAIQGARLAGAAEIHAIDLDDRKLELARRFGATHTGPPDEPVDFAFDVVGAGVTMSQAVRMLGHAGTAVLVGIADGPLDLSTGELFARRARVLVSHGGDHLPAEDFPRLAQWALEGKLDLAGMVTRTGALEDWKEAFDAMQEGDVIRTVLRP
jgi:S-(hydroxymethyl)mycothiol dehydrogenase